MAAASSASSAASFSALVGILEGASSSEPDPPLPPPPKNDVMPGPVDGLARAAFFAGGFAEADDLGSDAGVGRLPRTSARDLAGSPLDGPAGVVVVGATGASSGDRDGGSSAPASSSLASAVTPAAPERSSSSSSAVSDRGSDCGRSGVPADLPPLPGAATSVSATEVPIAPAPTFSFIGESPPPAAVSFAPVAPGAVPAWSSSSDASIRVALLSRRRGTRVLAPLNRADLGRNILKSRTAGARCRCRGLLWGDNNRINESRPPLRARCRARSSVRPSSRSPPDTPCHPRRRLRSGANTPPPRGGALT